MCVFVCVVIFIPLFNQKEKKRKTPEPTYKGFLIRAKTKFAKARPQIPDGNSCPNPSHLEAPTMKLHLVIVSKIYLYCLSQSICPA